MAQTQRIAETVEAVTHRSTAFDELMVGQDAMEGMGALAQKRKPQWHNR